VLDDGLFHEPKIVRTYQLKRPERGSSIKAKPFFERGSASISTNATRLIPAAASSRAR